MTIALAKRWTEACERLGVQPKQFAVLVGATVLAIGALVARSAFTPGKRGSAPRAATAAAAVAGSAAGATPAAHVRPATTVRCALQSRPARDPFRPFFLAADAAPEHSAPGQPAAPVVAAVAPAPTGLSLRAIIAGEYAVIGDQTVGVGDEVTDGEGRRFTVEEIHERRVVLREGGRRTELGYALPGAARGAAKGVRK